MTIVRRADPQDAEPLKRLNDLFNGEGCNSAENITASLLHNNQEIVCVASEGDSLVGFCCGQVFRSMCYENHHAEITELFVREECRRRGVGTRLIAFMEAEFCKQGIRHFQLFTGASNAAAQAFYRSCGYRATGEMMFRKKPPENS